MDWRREAKEKLQQHEAKKNALLNVREEIENLESAFSGIRSASADGTPVAGGGSTREDIMLNNIFRRSELEKARNRAQTDVEQVEKALAQLTDSERLILERFYIHPRKNNVRQICEDLHIEQPTAYRWRDSALRHFTIAMYGTVET